jgi:hypothetical protein
MSGKRRFADETLAGSVWDVSWAGQVLLGDTLISAFGLEVFKNRLIGERALPANAAPDALLLANWATAPPISQEVLVAFEQTSPNRSTGRSGFQRARSADRQQHAVADRARSGIVTVTS